MGKRIPPRSGCGPPESGDRSWEEGLQQGPCSHEWRIFPISLLKNNIRNWFWIWWKVYTTIEDINGFNHLVSIFLLLVLVSSCHPGKSPLSFSLTQYVYDRVDFTSDSRSGQVAKPGQTEHYFPPAVLISSNQWQFGSCAGGKLARDRGGAGARRQISGNQMLDPALPEDRNYLCTL